MKQPYGFSHPDYIRKKMKRSFKRLDFDRDGVPNYKDCQPLNPFKQDVKPNIEQRKRIEKLPITVGSRGHSKRYHVLEKVPKSLKKTQKIALGILKTRPDVIGEVERNKPKELVFVPTFKGSDEEEYEGFARGEYAVISAQPYTKRPSQLEKWELGSTAVHELEHTRQKKSYHGKRFEKLFKEKTYAKRKGERLAFEKERKLGQKYAYKSKEEFAEDVEEFMEREFD